MPKQSSIEGAHRVCALLEQDIAGKLRGASVTIHTLWILWPFLALRRDGLALDNILKPCDRVILMDKGKIIADGVPSVIMGDEILMEAHGKKNTHSLVVHYIPH